MKKTTWQKEKMDLLMLETANNIAEVKSYSMWAYKSARQVQNESILSINTLNYLDNTTSTELKEAKNECITVAWQGNFESGWFGWLPIHICWKDV
jgi:hypothetical protein